MKKMQKNFESGERIMATDKAMLGIYEHISELEKKIDEKDVMIDWLVSRLQSYCNNPLIINCSECRKHGCHNNNWRKAAQGAVKKDV